MAQVQGDHSKCRINMSETDGSNDFDVHGTAPQKLSSDFATELFVLAGKCAKFRNSDAMNLPVRRWWSFSGESDAENARKARFFDEVLGETNWFSWTDVGEWGVRGSWQSAWGETRLSKIFFFPGHVLLEQLKSADDMEF